MFQSVLRRLRESQTAELEGGEAAEAGFTLIELMVVLLIIAILLAIAIPTFLGVTSSANDRAVQSNLTNGLTEASSQYQANAQTYTGVQANLVTSAPEFTWATAATACTTATPNCISVGAIDLVTAADAQGAVLAAMSKTGTCWYVAQLQANPVLINPDTGGTSAFISVVWNATPAVGMAENAGGTANLTTAGTYYAERKAPAAGQCDAAYPTTVATGFKWGTSYSSPGVD